LIDVEFHSNLLSTLALPAWFDHELLNASAWTGRLSFLISWDKVAASFDSVCFCFETPSQELQKIMITHNKQLFRLKVSKIESQILAAPFFYDTSYPGCQKDTTTDYDYHCYTSPRNLAQVSRLDGTR
jgi:hypothetical protein